MPVRARSTASPPSVARQSGSSALGSAKATEPQTVPRLRVWTWPSRGSAAASIGDRRASGGQASNSAWVVAAPTSMTAPSSLISPRPGSREMSMSTAGSTSRMLSIGINV